MAYEFLQIFAGVSVLLALSIIVGVGIRIGCHLVDIVFAKFFDGR